MYLVDSVIHPEFSDIQGSQGMPMYTRYRLILWTLMQYSECSALRDLPGPAGSEGRWGW